MYTHVFLLPLFMLMYIKILRATCLHYLWWFLRTLCLWVEEFVTAILRFRIVYAMKFNAIYAIITSSWYLFQKHLLLGSRKSKSRMHRHFINHPTLLRPCFNHFPPFCRFFATLAGTNRKADMDFSSSVISISSDFSPPSLCIKCDSDGGGKDGVPRVLSLLVLVLVL